MESIQKMTVVILAGGFGTRISEESYLKAKPMIEIGGKPILWHIMKTYSTYGFNEFIICLGYKSYGVKEYFSNYLLYHSDVTFDFTDNSFITHQNTAEPWKVTLVDTGLETMTGGRLKRIRNYIDEKPFMLTYGDGLADVNICELVKFHREHGKYATVTAVQPSGRYGKLNLDKTNQVSNFDEKPLGDGGWINGGFFVFQPEIFDYIEGDHVQLEKEPLENLAKDHQLMAYKHTSFWKAMDTLRDKNELEQLWKKNGAPWKKW